MPALLKPLRMDVILSREDDERSQVTKLEILRVAQDDDVSVAAAHGRVAGAAVACRGTRWRPIPRALRPIARAMRHSAKRSLCMTEAFATDTSKACCARQACLALVTARLAPLSKRVGDVSKAVGMGQRARVAIVAGPVVMRSNALVVLTMMCAARPSRPVVRSLSLPTPFLSRHCSSPRRQRRACRALACAARRVRPRHRPPRTNRRRG
jgi:hypothetical protein